MINKMLLLHSTPGDLGVSKEPAIAQTGTVEPNYRSGVRATGYIINLSLRIFNFSPLSEYSHYLRVYVGGD